ncbi:hypothetical protein [Actinoallomurus sp. CA-150999]|uniref:hypothetical protein n=1 Tax=Actinoallomurus sp. CA-150999 TaxID=3239887 RepID=UPI003D93C79D
MIQFTRATGLRGPLSSIACTGRAGGPNGFVLWPLDDHERQYALFAEEVVPAVRAALATSPLR